MVEAQTDFESYLDYGYREIGAFESDYIFLYTDLRAFGQAAQHFATRDAFFEAIIQPLVANGQTVLVPTFTYTTEGIFDVEATPTRLGAINKWVVGRHNATRSEHPLFSIAAIGPKAHLVLNIGQSAFGADSVFERLRGQQAAFMHVGRPVAIGNTCVHYVEQMCGATYRYHKAFRTDVRRGGTTLGSNYTAFVRRRDVAGRDFDFTYSLADEELHEGIGVKEVGSNSNHTNLSCYLYDRAIEFLTGAFYKNPSIFTGDGYIEYD